MHILDKKKKRIFNLINLYENIKTAFVFENRIKMSQKKKKTIKIKLKPKNSK